MWFAVCCSCAGLLSIAVMFAAWVVRAWFMALLFMMVDCDAAEQQGRQQGIEAGD